jgi:biopolymer transport protein ExbD
MGAKLSGSSGKKYGIEQNADINVTPFVDVMLVLLIIFMVAAPLATQSLKLDLPPPLPSKQNKVLPMILVQLVDNGDIYVGQKDKSQTKTSVANLPGDLHNAFVGAGMTSPDDQKVTIHSTKHVGYGQFMSVLNALEKAGYDKVSLAIDATA